MEISPELMAGFDSLRFVELEYAPGLFQVEKISVDDELPFACVWRDLVDALNGVAMSS
jgi:hypothetical protein